MLLTLHCYVDCLSFLLMSHYFNAYESLIALIRNPYIGHVQPLASIAIAFMAFLVALREGDNFKERKCIWRKNF